MSGRRQIASSEKRVLGKSTTSQNRLGVGPKYLIGCESKTGSTRRILQLSAQHAVLCLTARDRPTWLVRINIPSRSAATTTSTSTGPASRRFGDPLEPIKEWPTMQSQPSKPIPTWRPPHGSGQELRKRKRTILSRSTFGSTGPRSRQPPGRGSTLRCKGGLPALRRKSDKRFAYWGSAKVKLGGKVPIAEMMPRQYRLLLTSSNEESTYCTR